MIALVLFKSSIKIRGRAISVYWLAPVAGAVAMIAAGCVTGSRIFEGLTADTDVNPIKILVLFLSMTLISVFLDNTGFFSYLAMAALRRAGRSQLTLILSLYAIVSVLTVFTSNDIIVLTFTPFICYFAKCARIDPMPYLVGEFVAANTWSMALIIGNPTNIYLATAAGASFISYMKVMLLPTLCSGMVSLGALLLIFRKKLSAQIQPRELLDVKLDKPLMIMGLTDLLICIALMTVSSYISLPMWRISFYCFIALYALAFAYLLIYRRPVLPIVNALKRTPFEIVPFILSMFVIVLSLEDANVTDMISRLLAKGNPVLNYGASSFLTANLINNIPMSVLFSSIIEPLDGTAHLSAMYASVIGSNVGAYLTPIGALAGIMWMNMLSGHDLKLSFGQFVRKCAPIALASLSAALFCLRFMLAG